MHRSATAILVKKITDTVLETGIRVNTVSAIMLPEGNEGKLREMRGKMRVN